MDWSLGPLWSFLFAWIRERDPNVLLASPRSGISTLTPFVEKRSIVSLRDFKNFQFLHERAIILRSRI